MIAKITQTAFKNERHSALQLTASFLVGCSSLTGQTAYYLVPYGLQM